MFREEINFFAILPSLRLENCLSKLGPYEWCPARICIWCRKPTFFQIKNTLITVEKRDVLIFLKFDPYHLQDYS